MQAGGDADTNAAVAGALLGCKVGYKNLPRVWLDALKEKDWLERKVQRLLGLMGLVDSKSDSKQASKGDAKAGDAGEKAEGASSASSSSAASAGLAAGSSGAAAAIPEDGRNSPSSAPCMMQLDKRDADGDVEM